MNSPKKGLPLSPHLLAEGPSSIQHPEITARSVPGDRKGGKNGQVPVASPALNGQKSWQGALCPSGTLPAGTSPAHLPEPLQCSPPAAPLCSCRRGTRPRHRAGELRCRCDSVATAKLFPLSWPRFPLPFLPTPLFVQPAPTEPHAAALGTDLQNHECPNHCKIRAKPHCKPPVRLGQWWWCRKGTAGLSRGKPLAGNKSPAPVLDTRWDTRGHRAGSRALCCRENWK